MISDSIELAIKLLNQEEVIGLPTETVYGLAGNIYSEKAIQKIYSIKKRPSFNPLIVHIKGLEDLENVARDIPVQARKLATAFWPGPLTLLLKKQSTVPDMVTAGKDSVAVRVPNHPIALHILRQLSFPLAAPSANPFSTISPTSAEHVEEYFKDDIALVLQGGICNNGVESTIIGFEGDQAILYRYGAISLEEIEALIGKVKIHNKENVQPDAPGMLYKHYAPKTRTYLSDDIISLIQQHKDQKIAVLAFDKPIIDNAIFHQIVLSPSGDLKEAAANLYHALYTLDKLNADVIIAQRFPDQGLGKTINDRLERASCL